MRMTHLPTSARALDAVWLRLVTFDSSNWRKAQYQLCLMDPANVAVLTPRACVSFVLSPNIADIRLLE